MVNSTPDTGAKAKKPKSGFQKSAPLVITIVVLIAVAFAVGYYLSMVRYDQKYTKLKESEEKAKEAAKGLEIVDILLKAKGEIISSEIALSREEVEKAMGFVDNSISILRGTYEKADDKTKNKIEDFRLKLATVKGYIEADASRAQTELDRLWREIDSLVKDEWEKAKIEE